MIELSIPGRGDFIFAHLVLDYNGTLGCDGSLLPGVKERLNLLAVDLQVHILTADTFGSCASACQGIDARLHILQAAAGGPEKEQYVAALGPPGVIAVGNGSNDRRMLARAALGIAVLGPEGASALAVQAADIVVPDINSALDLFLKPQRLIATLRE